MAVYAVLLYAVPAVLIAVTLWTGYLGFKFYLAEVVKQPDE
ncbi:hypothetical protein [Streptomyces winkii]|nr:hypothetical protein [Streptomyces sp. DSM 40971]